MGELKMLSFFELLFEFNSILTFLFSLFLLILLTLDFILFFRGIVLILDHLSLIFTDLGSLAFAVT